MKKWADGNSEFDIFLTKYESFYSIFNEGLGYQVRESKKYEDFAKEITMINSKLESVLTT